MKTDADPAESVPPTTVAATSPSAGTPPAAKNITGTVVSSSSSITRGLVRPTYAATTSRQSRDRLGPRTVRPGAVHDAGADWPT